MHLAKLYQLASLAQRICLKFKIGSINSSLSSIFDGSLVGDVGDDPRISIVKKPPFTHFPVVELLLADLRERDH